MLSLSTDRIGCKSAESGSRICSLADQFTSERAGAPFVEYDTSESVGASSDDCVAAILEVLESEDARSLIWKETTSSAVSCVGSRSPGVCWISSVTAAIGKLIGWLHALTCDVVLMARTQMR